MNSSALAICACIALATPAFSQNVEWDTVGPNQSGSFGNTLNFYSENKNLSVSSWGYTKGSSDTAFETARGSQYTIGMGVSNADETTSNPDHQVDNGGADDWMLFYFDEMVGNATVTIDPYGTYDRDVTYYTATLDGPVDLTNLTYADLVALGFSARHDSYSTVSGDARQVLIEDSPGGYNAILFGAWQGEPTTDSLDCFKISGVSATYTGAPNPYTSVPEPATAVLGLLGSLALLRRRR
jgi:uncharacterized protein (TIGR03382 family)